MSSLGKKSSSPHLQIFQIKISALHSGQSQEDAISELEGLGPPENAASPKR